jgi:hypothetical protein
MQWTAPRSIEWRVGFVVGGALASAVAVAAGCQSAEDAFAAILAAVCVHLGSHSSKEAARHNWTTLFASW